MAITIATRESVRMMPSSKLRSAIARGLGLTVLAASVHWPTPAHAINGERYLVCRGDVAADGADPAREAARGARRRVKRRAVPPKLAPAPTPAIDLPIAEPLPSQSVSLESAPLPTIRTSSRQDFRCTGFVRGERGILAVLSAPPGARFADHPHPTSWIVDNIEASGSAGLAAAKPYLRRELERPIPETVADHVRLDRLRLKVAAAQALADLGDNSSVVPMLAFLESREKADFPGYWEDTLQALARLDPAAAEVYALAVLARSGESTEHDVGEQNRVRRALPLIVTPSARAVDVLTKLSNAVDDDPAHPGKHLTCLVLAARIRGGDVTLRDEVRPELATDIRTQRGAQCYSELVAAAFPGQDASEVETLLFRHRYEELLLLVSSIRSRETRGQLTARDREAQRKIRAWLQERAADPDIADAASRGIPSRRTRALHLALSAALGDQAAQRSLYALVDDAKDDTIAPWVGARAALDLGLDGAADHAAARLRLAHGTHTSTVAHGEWASRGRVVVTEHVEVIDRLASRGDVRFALGLLDRQSFARQAAFEHLARARPVSACGVVVAAARGAEEKSIQDAFWALTVLGDACRDPMRALASDAKAPKAARGMALEHLAMIRDGSIANELAHAGRGDEIRPARERARLIQASRP